MASHTALKRKLKQVALRPEQNIPKKKKKVEPKPEISDTKYFIQFKSAEGEKTGTLCEISSDFTTKQLNELLNAFLPNEEKHPYYFYVNGMEITTNVRDALIEMHKLRGEEVKSYEEETLEITYFPQALFLVRPVTRCTASLPGHSEAILNVQFSPDGTKLASGSGDATVRIWDNNSEMPMHTLKGHTNWVFCVAWSPDAKKIASGGRDGIIKVWWGESGQKIGKPLRGHKKWITAISWEPFHLNTSCRRLASSSKDETIKVWDVVTSRLEFTLSGHSKGVTCVKWNGDGCLYSCSQDCTVICWSVEERLPKKIFKGHAHWVNHMSLSTDYVLRRGAFDHMCEPIEDLEEARKKAEERYNKTIKQQPFRIVSCSDDNTLIIWEPEKSDKPIARLTGHQGVVNAVSFSPDGKTIASVSFDKSVRLWDASTGKFQGKLSGHVGAVYQVAWSGDSRMIVTSSRDATAKVWNVKTKKLVQDLPGHFDEVYTVDWSPDGQRVASGGKDRILKIWRH